MRLSTLVTDLWSEVRQYNSVRYIHIGSYYDRDLIVKASA